MDYHSKKTLWILQLLSKQFSWCKSDVTMVWLSSNENTHIITISLLPNPPPGMHRKAMREHLAKQSRVYLHTPFPCTVLSQHHWLQEFKILTLRRQEKSFVPTFQKKQSASIYSRLTTFWYALEITKSQTASYWEVIPCRWAYRIKLPTPLLGATNSQPYPQSSLPLWGTIFSNPITYLPWRWKQQVLLKHW